MKRFFGRFSKSQGAGDLISAADVSVSGGVLRKVTGERQRPQVRSDLRNTGSQSSVHFATSVKQYADLVLVGGGLTSSTFTRALTSARSPYSMIMVDPSLPDPGSRQQRHFGSPSTCMSPSSAHFALLEPTLSPHLSHPSDCLILDTDTVAALTPLLGAHVLQQISAPLHRLPTLHPPTTPAGVVVRASVLRAALLCCPTPHPLTRYAKTEALFLSAGREDGSVAVSVDPPVPGDYVVPRRALILACGGVGGGAVSDGGETSTRGGESMYRSLFSADVAGTGGAARLNHTRGNAQSRCAGREAAIRTGRLVVRGVAVVGVDGGSDGAVLKEERIPLGGVGQQWEVCSLRVPHHVASGGQLGGHAPSTAVWVWMATCCAVGMGRTLAIPADATSGTSVSSVSAADEFAVEWEEVDVESPASVPDSVADFAWDALTRSAEGMEEQARAQCDTPSFTQLLDATAAYEVFAETAPRDAPLDDHRVLKTSSVVAVGSVVHGAVASPWFGSLRCASIRDALCLSSAMLRDPSNLFSSLGSRYATPRSSASIWMLGLHNRSVSDSDDAAAAAATAARLGAICAPPTSIFDDVCGGGAMGTSAVATSGEGVLVHRRLVAPSPLAVVGRRPTAVAAGQSSFPAGGADAGGGAAPFETLLSGGRGGCWGAAVGVGASAPSPISLRRVPHSKEALGAATDDGCCVVGVAYGPSLLWRREGMGQKGEGGSPWWQRVRTFVKGAFSVGGQNSNSKGDGTVYTSPRSAPCVSTLSAGEEESFVPAGADFDSEVFAVVPLNSLSEDGVVGHTSPFEPFAVTLSSTLDSNERLPLSVCDTVVVPSPSSAPPSPTAFSDDGSSSVTLCGYTTRWCAPHPLHSAAALFQTDSAVAVPPALRTDASALPSVVCGVDVATAVAGLGVSHTSSATPATSCVVALTEADVIAFVGAISSAYNSGLCGGGVSSSSWMRCVVCDGCVAKWLERPSPLLQVLRGQSTRAAQPASSPGGNPTDSSVDGWHCNGDSATSSFGVAVMSTSSCMEEEWVPCKMLISARLSPQLIRPVSQLIHHLHSAAVGSNVNSGNATSVEGLVTALVEGTSPTSADLARVASGAWCDAHLVLHVCALGGVKAVVVGGHAVDTPTPSVLVKEETIPYMPRRYTAAQLRTMESSTPRGAE